MSCEACGHAVPEGSRFCNHCGAALERACPACRNTNPPGSRFCNGCGGPLDPGEPASTRATPRDYTPKHLAEKILQSKSALEGERKQVTVFFADVKSSMGLQEAIDPEEWHGIMDRFFEILAEGVHRFEGTINQYTGDGIMALFGAPIAHEDHAQRACYAALHVRGALRRYADEMRIERGFSFSVRMGLNSGEVVVGKIGDDLRMDYTAQGHTVGLASRMESLAEPGRAYVTAHTARLVEGYFKLRDLGASRIAGLSEPIHVHELEDVGALRTRLDVSRARGFSRFVGRADELSALELAFKRVVEGNGQVVGVVGEAGVGKSRLCNEFLKVCGAKEVPVYSAHCPAHGRTIPFLPLLELLRDYFGVTERDGEIEVREKIAGRLLLLDRAMEEVLPLVFDFLGVADPDRPPAESDPDVRQRQLFAFVRRLVQARSSREPAVFFVDDMHWIDPGSDAFLAQFVEAIAGTRTLLLVNFRPEYRADWMAMSYYEQLALQPLTDEALSELITDLIGEDPSVRRLRERIRDRTAGNPFFVEEIVQSLVESSQLVGNRGAYRLADPSAELEIPTTVQAVLAARIDRLAEREKHVLQTSAVLGKEFTGPILREVAELQDADLAEAVDLLKRGEFLYELALYPEPEYAFKHPLTQSVAYGSQLGERRRGIHERAARSIERLHSGSLDEQSALLAYHWEGAEQPLEAARWHSRAAAWVQGSNYLDAVRHWEKVRGLLGASPEPGEPAELAMKARASLVVWGARTGASDAETESLLSEARALAQTSGDVHSLALILVNEALTKFIRGDHARGLSTLDEHDGLGDDSAEARINSLSLRAVFLNYTGHVSGALARAEEALALQEQHPDTRSMLTGAPVSLMVQVSQCMALTQLGRLENAGAKLAVVMRECGPDGPLVARSIATYVAARYEELVGEPGKALVVSAQLLEALAEVELLGPRAQTGLALGMSLLLHGRIEEATAELERALALIREHGVYRQNETSTLYYLSRANRLSGNVARARQLARDAVSLSWKRGEGLARTYAELEQARALLASEPLDADAVRTCLDRVEQISREYGLITPAPFVWEERGRLAEKLADLSTRDAELREAHRLYVEIGATGHARRLAEELDPADGL